MDWPIPTLKVPNALAASTLVGGMSRRSDTNLRPFSRDARGPAKPAGEQSRMRTVVVAVDWSAVSKRALDLAAEIARAMKGRVVLVHVRDPSDPFASTSVSSGQARAPDGPEELAEAWASQVRRSGLRDVRTVLLDGPPVDALLGYVEANPPDILVFGRRGHSSGTRMLLGGITSSVLQNAQCPVLVVP